MTRHVDFFDHSQGARAEAARAEPIELARQVTASGALPIIGLSCLRQCALNRVLAHAGDAEGIHQMRVALRRLRAAIWLFKAMLGDAETEAIEGKLRWLTEQLGPVRDHDVFLDECVVPLKESHPRRQELEQLEAALRVQRAEGADLAKRALESEQFRQLLLDTALWLVGGAWSSASAGPARHLRQRCLTKLARTALAKRHKKLVRELTRLHELQPAERHKLRITAKKLRYASEFCASLFSRKRGRERYVRQLEKLQDSLGKLNDFRVHDALGQRAVHGTTSESRVAVAFAVGLIGDAERERAPKLLEAAARAGKKLAAMPSYWA